MKKIFSMLTLVGFIDVFFFIFGIGSEVGSFDELASAMLTLNCARSGRRESIADSQRAAASHGFPASNVKQKLVVFIVPFFSISNSLK